jgi:hypothetical protein
VIATAARFHWAISMPTNVVGILVALRQPPQRHFLLRVEGLRFLGKTKSQKLPVDSASFFSLSKAW